MAPFVKVIRLNSNKIPANWDDQNNGHGRYDPDDTKTIGDLKIWISHECDALQGSDKEDLVIGFATIDGYEKSNNDDILLWRFILFGNGGPNEPLPNDRMDNTEICNLLQTIEENTMVLYVWQFEQSRGQLRDLFGGATNVEIIFNKDMKIIVAEPGHTARGFFNAKTVKKNDPPATYKLTSFNEERLYLFIGDINPSTIELYENKKEHEIRKFKIPRTTTKVRVESTECLPFFTLICLKEEEDADGTIVSSYEIERILWKKGVQYPFHDVLNKKESFLKKHFFPFANLVLPLVKSLATGSA